MQMDESAGKAEAILPVLLGAIVLTQIVYVAKSALKIEIASAAIWSVEALLFLAIAVIGLVAALQKSRLLACTCIAIAGMVNVLQVGMGLTMFGPLFDAGEPLIPVYESVVAMAFFLFFSGKLLFGCAAIVVGMDLRRSGGAVRLVGLTGIAAGLVAMLVNFGGMAVGMDWLYPAGATGTIATVLLAVALHLQARPAMQIAG